MSIHINQYYPLLFLLPVALILWFTYRRFLSGHYQKSLWFRGLTVLLLILSMCGIHLVHEAKDTTTVFLADLSNSTLDKREEMEVFIRAAIRSKSEDDLVGIIAFGSDTVVEVNPDVAPVFDAFESRIGGEFTNIQKGLISANALMPGNTKRRIVLLTDGYENIGDARKQVGAIIGNRTALDAVDMSDHSFAEVQLEEIVVPEKVEKDQMIDIQAKIYSNVKTNGTLYIYSNNR